MNNANSNTLLRAGARLKSASAGLALLVLALSSCNEEIQVFAPDEFIPVVYCLLNPGDSIQTIRISRLFQDKRSQTEWQSGYNDYLTDSLNRIYIESIAPSGIRESIRFKWKEQIRQATDSLYTRSDLYTALMHPGYGTDYQLYVYFPEIRKMVSAKIRTANRIQLVDPVLVPGRKLVIAPTQPYVVRWYGAPGTTYFQGIIDLNYLEQGDGQIVAKSVRMTLLPFFSSDVGILNSQNISGMHLLRTLRDNIPVQEGVRRKMAGIDFTFYYGGEELALFVHAGYDPKGPEGTVVDFTNLDNGRGLFSSIAGIRVTGIPLAEQSLDTIALNSLTRDLNFLRSYEDFK